MTKLQLGGYLQITFESMCICIARSISTEWKKISKISGLGVLFSTAKEKANKPIFYPANNLKNEKVSFSGP